MNSTHTKQTDTPHKVKIDSQILCAVWATNKAIGGAEAIAEVRTSFVGNGADIEINCRATKGKDPGKIKGKIYNNLFVGPVPIPEKVDPEAYVWFEAKLPKQGLKLESNEIPAFPPIILRKMQWDRKEARRGDVVKLHAQFEGVRGDEEATVVIYEYDRDGAHDPSATIPTQLKGRDLQLEWEYQYFEDTDEIPTQAELQKYGRSYNPPEYFFVVIIDGFRAGMKQESGLLKFKDDIDLQLLDHNNMPLADRSCSIVFADGATKQCKSDGNGAIQMKNIAPGTGEIKVEFKGQVNHQIKTGEPRKIVAGSKVSISSGKPITVRFLPDLRLRFVEESWNSGAQRKALAGAAVEIEVDGTTVSGKTDSNGIISLGLPENGTEGRIVLHHLNGIDYIYPILFNSLLAVEEKAGVVQRLRALGFIGGRADPDDARLEIAVKGFQAGNGLAITGRIDDATKQALITSYGG